MPQKAQPSSPAAARSQAIFVNYRRDDCGPAAQHLAEDLQRRFGADQVFFDSRAIAPGAAWPDEIRSALQAARVVVVCIGDRWHRQQNPETGQNRLDEPHDWVLAELRAAASQPGRVVPVLVGDEARLPGEAIALRRDISYLNACQAIVLRGGDERDHGLDRLCKAIERRGVPKVDSPEFRLAPLADGPKPRQESFNMAPGECKDAGGAGRAGRWRWWVAGLILVALLWLWLGTWHYERPRPGLDMVEIPAGSFVMGSPTDESGRFALEGPTRTVIIKAFRLARTEVTNAQYRVFVEATKHRAPDTWTDRRFNSADQPVVGVSWDDAEAYCTWAGLRLPSEAEWEYACRATTKTAFWFGDDESQLGTFGWYGANSEGQPRPVAKKPANPWGLHDMHGNVWEWCKDWRGDYRKAPTDGSAQLQDDGSGLHVLRGGSWRDCAGDSRSALRHAAKPIVHNEFVGCRPAS